MNWRPISARLIAIPSALATSVLLAYRVFLSPILVSVLGPACRFEPTCSTYACAAVSTYGAMRGGLMAVRRLLRCRPGGGSGYDPVPGRENVPPSLAANALAGPDNRCSDA